MSLSIGGPLSPLPGPLRSDPSERTEAEPSGGSGHRPAGGAASFHETSTALAPGHSADRLGVDASLASPSAHVDPELWALLGGDERAFYLRNSITSPATYGPAVSAGAARPGARVGVRLDVRA